MSERDESVTMRRFEGKATRKGSEPKVAIHVNDGGATTALRFNAKAKEDYLEGVQYVDYYLADDGSMVGVKPVEGQDVTDASYSLSFNSASFGAVASDLNLDLDDTWRLECTWDDDAKMVVFDVSDLPREGDE